MARHVACKVHFVGDDEHRAAFLGQRAHDAEHFADELGIERRGRLVEQHHLRPHRKRARDRRALLLAARQMRGIVIAPLGHAHSRKQRLRFLDAFLARTLLHMHRRFDQVFQHRQMRPEIEALEHHAELGADAVDLFPVGRTRGPVAFLAHLDRLARDGDDAEIRRLQKIDATQKRALARTRRAEDRDDVAVASGKRNAAQDFDLAEALGELVYGQGRRFSGHSGFP